VTTRDEILTAALLLPERDRLEIAGQLLETVAGGPTGNLADEEFLDELDRRAGDLEGAVPAEELWLRDKNRE
jgi:hypothetical protein